MTQANNSAKRVLIFNPLKRLVGIHQSAFAIAKANDWNLSSIRSACSGKIISYKKLYFRYLNDDIEVGLDDLGVLDLEEYDKLCETPRKTYANSKMTRKDMKYTKRPKQKSEFYPFKHDPNGKSQDDCQNSQQIETPAP